MRVLCERATSVDFRIPFQCRQFIFLPDLINGLENTLLDRLRALRITRQEQQKRDEADPDETIPGTRHQ
jgi:hypothetical protein